MQKEIRCMDLVGEAFGSYKAQQGGCHHTQARLLGSSRALPPIMTRLA